VRARRLSSHQRVTRLLGRVETSDPSHDPLEDLDLALRYAFDVWLRLAMLGVALVALALWADWTAVSRWLAVATAAAFVLLLLNMIHAKGLDALLREGGSQIRRSIEWRIARPWAGEIPVVVVAALSVAIFTGVF
jgi:Zn-dependent protease